MQRMQALHTKNDTYTPCNTWDNMTLFDFNGSALSSIKVLNQPAENLLSNISFENDGVTTTPADWNVWLSDSSDTGTVKTEYGYAYDGDYKLTFWDDSAYSALYIRHLQIFPTVRINSQFGQRPMGIRMCFSCMRRIMEGMN